MSASTNNPELPGMDGIKLPLRSPVNEGCSMTAVLKNKIPMKATNMPNILAIKSVEPNQRMRKANKPMAIVKMADEIDQLRASPATAPRILPVS